MATDGEKTPLLCSSTRRSNGSSEVDPFAPVCHMTWWQVIKVAVGAVTLLPIRIVLTIIIVSTGILVVYLMDLGLAHGPTEPVKPLTGWRRILQRVCVVLVRAWLWVCGFYYIPVRGKMASREEAPVLVVAPHSSYMDALSPLTAQCSVVTRRENYKTPIVGVCMNAMQPIYVDRHLGDSRQQALNEILRRSANPDWPQVLIFPEGTCTNQTALLPFKKGPFVAGLPVQPVLYRYTNKLDCTSWTVSNTLYLIFVLYCQFINYLEVEFLPVYNPSEEEKADPLLYAENVRQLMAKELNIPLSDASHRNLLSRLEQNVKDEKID